MPREYQIKPGTPSPSPMQFGSADINLQTPRFVAQTNVAPSENPFQVLQKILGLATDIAGQAITMQSRDIEGKINYQRAVEAQQEKTETEKRRTEAEQRRLEAEEAARYEAQARLRISAATTKEEAEAVKAEAIRTKDGESTAMMTSRSQVAASAGAMAGQLETKSEQFVLDSMRAIRATEDTRIQNAFEAGNVKGLEGLLKTYAEQASKAKTTEEQALYNGLRSTTFEKLTSVNNDAERLAYRDEKAAAAMAGGLAKQLAQPIVNAYAANMVKSEKDFEGVSDESLTAAMFDAVRDKILEDNPELLEIWWMGSESEQTAISESITEAVQPVLNRMIAMRNERNVIQAKELTVNSYIQEAKDKGFDQAYTKATAVDVLDPRTQNAVIRGVTRAAIESQSNDVDKIRESGRIISTYGDAEASREAYRLQREAIKRIGENLDMERQSILTEADLTGTVFPVDDAAVGWASKFPDKDSFISWVLESKLGTDIQTFRNSQNLQIAFGDLITKVGSQYDADVSKTGVNIRLQEAEFRRNNPSTKRSMTTEEGWKVSPMSTAMQDGSYKRMSESQLTDMLMDSLVGYSNVAVPTDLAKHVITGYDNPDNFTLVKAFWNIQSIANDPTVRNTIDTNDDYRASWSMGLYLKHLDSNPEISGQTTTALAAEFAKNIKAYQKPNAQTPESRERTKILGDVVSMLNSGEWLDTGWADFTGYDPKDIVGKHMDAGSKIRMLELAPIAASAPDVTDKGKFLGDVLRDSGYAVYSYYKEDGGRQFRLVRNVPGLNKTTPLPDPSELHTRKWNDYLDSKKAAIADVLTNSRQIGVSIKYKPENIQKVYINPLEVDLNRGQCALKAFVSGRWINIDAYQLSITKEDYESWGKSYVPATVSAPVDMTIRPKF